MFLDVIVDNFDNLITENNGSNSLVIASIAAGIIIALVLLLVFVLRYKKRNKQ